MQTFSRSFAAFVAENWRFLLFVGGFAVFCGSLSQWSAPLGGAVGGAMAMGIAAYPHVVRRG